MKRIVFLRTEERQPVRDEEKRLFYRLFRQAVLQELKEQGFIDDFQLQRCLEKLDGGR